MAKQVVKFTKATGITWAMELANGDTLTGVEEVHFDIEGKGGPFINVKFKIDSATLETPPA